MVLGSLWYPLSYLSLRTVLRRLTRPCHHSRGAERRLGGYRILLSIRQLVKERKNSGWDSAPVNMALLCVFYSMELRTWGSGSGGGMLGGFLATLGSWET